MKQTVHHSKSEKETQSLAAKLAKLLKGSEIICLFGDLGAGKTTFVKGMAKAFKIDPKTVSSPTFVFLNIYKGKLPLYHFDLYRVEDIEDLGGIGYDEFLYGEGVALVEWADKLGELMPKEYLSIEICHKGADTRDLKINAVGEKYDKLIKGLK